MKAVLQFVIGLLGLAFVTPLLAVKVGDSYETVIAAKGDPSMRMEREGVAILKYDDETIKLRDNKVVAIEPVAESAEPPRPAVRKGEWTTDYNAASAQAKTEGKLIFLFFTGSDWCGWCKRLDREILSTSEFRNFAREELFLVKLDFPRNYPQTAVLKQQNEKLAKQYGIRGFPTVIVLNSKGKKVASLGYQEGGPGPFIAELKRL